MQTTRKKLKKTDILRMALCLLTPVSLAFIAYARANTDWAERVYSLGFYQRVSLAISSLTSRVPFCIGEWLLLLFYGGCAAYLICWIVAVIRRRGSRLRTLWEYLFSALAIASVLLAGFVATCGLNYYRYPFTYYSGLDPQPTELSVLEEYSAVLVTQTNELRAACDEDEAGVFILDGRTPYELARIAGESMSLMGQRYGEKLFCCGAATEAKPLTLSEGMSYIDLLGQFMPYTMEAMVNVHPWNYEMPSVMCHELSHVCGFMREDEANFIAYNACMATGDADFMYSGTVLALIHTTNALYAKDIEAYRTVMGELGDGPLRDLRAASAYWERYDTPVAEASNAVNDAYLKANAQQDGVASYGRMVDLLIAQYLTEQN